MVRPQPVCGSVLGTKDMATYYGGSGNDSQTGSSDADSIFGYGGNDTISGQGGVDSIYGGDGADSINAGDGDDFVYAGTGNDTITASKGYDQVYGDAGNDSLSGGSDTYDDLYGGAGDDSIYAGNAGYNWGFGGEGNDLLYGGDGEQDLLHGGTGNDTAHGGNGNDVVLGGTGNDQVFGDAGNDFVAGDDGADTVDGGTGADTIEGGQGRDSLIGGDGADLIRGDIRTFDPAFYTSGPSSTPTTVSFTNTSSLTIRVYWIDQTGTPQLYARLSPGQSWNTTTYAEHNWMLTDAATGSYLGVYEGALAQSITYAGDFNDTISGGQGADTIYTDFGDDSVEAGSENDLVYGGAGKDTVYGGWGDDSADLGAGNDSFGSWSNEGGNDTVYGGLGDDSIIGGGENDLLYGGTGNDTLSGGVGNDSSYGGEGNDVVVITDDHNQDFYDLGENAGDMDAMWFANYVSTNGVSVTFSGTDAGSYAFAGGYATGSFTGLEGLGGTEYADTLNAGADNDGVVIYGLGGADSITGGSGNDLIDGGAGHDTIYFGAGNDTVYGGAGNDLIDDRLNNLEPGASFVDAGDGDDTIWSGGGADTVQGGAGNDQISAEDGDDLVQGGGGNDSLYGGLGNDTLDGGLGADLVMGDGGSDKIDLTTADSANDSAYGGLGDDTLTTRIDLDGGGDALYGGDGRDFFVAGAGDSVFGGEGGYDYDILDLSSAPVGGTITLTGQGAGTASSSGSTLTFADIEYIATTAYADSIDGQADGGGMYYDTRGGNDTIRGGTGADSVKAGTGNDLIMGGGGADHVNGDDGDDTVFGEDGNDTLNGDAGNDLLYGGTGDDWLLSAMGNDSAYGGSGNDFLNNMSGNAVLEGGDGNDSLFGGDGEDTLRGGAGADSLNGGTGNDLLDYSDATAGVFVDIDSGFTGLAAAGDTLSGFEGVSGSAFADTLQGRAAADSLYGGGGDDSLRARGGNDTVDGGSGNDLIEGNEGADSLIGGAGDDTLSGGIGNDRLQGGDGRDSFVVVEASGDDTVLDFQMARIDGLTTDRLDVSSLRHDDGSPVRSWDVSVRDDGFGNARLTFPQGEILVLQGVSPSQVSAPGALVAMGVPCFVAGARIDTLDGPRRIEAIRVGDDVLLEDGSVAPVLWVGQRRLGAAEVAARPQQAPVQVLRGHHGAERNLLLSPQHGVEVQLAGQGRALVRAAHLARLGWGARLAPVMRDVSYHHILLPRHGLVRANGVICESLYPGPFALAGLAPAQRMTLAQTILSTAPAGRGGTLDSLYGPRALPLLSFSQARRWHAQACPAVFPGGNRSCLGGKSTADSPV